MIMTQGTLPFQYQSEKNETSLTSFSGLPLYFEWMNSTGLAKKTEQILSTKIQGWTDLQIISSLILLNIAGGDCVDDIENLEEDAGLKTLLLKFETHSMKRKARRAYERRWRKKKLRAFPSLSVIRRYLEKFHFSEEENNREQGKAFIPKQNEFLQKLISLNNVLVNFSQQKNPVKTATLDMDATLSETHKRKALYCYKNFKAYQPVNVYWAEQKILLHTEFRDGNVPAQFELLRILKESLDKLPEKINTVYFRSDTAGYQENILKYCAKTEHERFEKIEFSISARISVAFKAEALLLKDSAWQPVIKTDKEGNKYKTGQEWAEVGFVPDWVVKNKFEQDYRYIAIREKMESLKPKQSEDDLPFQTISVKQERYKLFGIVTNRALPGSELIQWHHERCGDSEKVHSIEKNELAGGQFPSGLFGANAAWWHIMVMAFNLNQLLKQLAMPEKLKPKGLKALRFLIIGVAGRVINHARQFSLRLSGGVEKLNLFLDIRSKIQALGLVFDSG